eukprot:COSAG01_NODE_64492_length_276_cov_0.819209_1_plen_40_part_10
MTIYVAQGEAFSAKSCTIHTNRDRHTNPDRHTRVAARIAS